MVIGLAFLAISLSSLYSARGFIILHIYSTAPQFYEIFLFF